MPALKLEVGPLEVGSTVSRHKGLGLWVLMDNSPKADEQLVPLGAIYPCAARVIWIVRQGHFTKGSRNFRSASVCM